MAERASATTWLAAGICAFGVAVGAQGAPADVSGSHAQEVQDARASGWLLEDADNDLRTGFRLYSRPSKESAFSAYRFEAHVEATPGEACEAALLYASSPDRAPAGQNRTILEQLPGSLLLHTHIEVPMAADREVTTRIAMRRDEATHSCRLEWTDANEEGPTPVEGRVRIVRSRGFWAFAPFQSGSEEGARVVYESYADLGGRVPAWLVESMMRSSIAAQIDDLRSLITERSADDSR